MLVSIASLTIVVRDKREGLSCPSASLFQSKGPGYDKIQFHPSNINGNVKETFTSFQIILRRGEPDVNPENGVMSVGFILRSVTCAILLINKTLSRAFCSLS